MTIFSFKNLSKMEINPPTFSSIALKKNKINFCLDDVFPFFVFLRTPSHYDYSFEINQTDQLSKAIDFISPKIEVSPEKISLLNIQTKEKLNTESLTFNDFKVGDIILVSYDGKIPGDDIPELPPEIGAEPENDNPKFPETQEQEQRPSPSDAHSQDSQASNTNEEINMADLTISDIRRILTTKQKDFVNNLVLTYNIDEATVSQIFLMNEKDEARTEEMIAQLVS